MNHGEGDDEEEARAAALERRYERYLNRVV